MPFYIGEWQWIQPPDKLDPETGQMVTPHGYWQPPHPAQCRGCLDLRTLFQMGRQGPDAQAAEKYGVFMYDTDPGDPALVLIGNNKADAPTAANKTTLEKVLGVSVAGGETVATLLWKAMTESSVPRPRLRNDKEGTKKLIIGGQLLKQQKAIAILPE